MLSSSDPPRPSKAYALVKFFSNSTTLISSSTVAYSCAGWPTSAARKTAKDVRDSTEGVWAWLQKQDLQIHMDVPAVRPINITECDLAAPVSISLGEPDHLYIYCMYAYYIEKALPGDDARDIYGEDRLADLEAALQVDPRCLRFGPHAVVIPWRPFMERIEHAARSQSLRLRAGLVRYYDDEVFNGEFKLKDVPFRKQKRFDYQREFRICIKTLDRSPMPRTFNVGSLRGLGGYMPSEHVRKALSFSGGQSRLNV